jgi:hypothetical protein
MAKHAKEVIYVSGKGISNRSDTTSCGGYGFGYADEMKQRGE